MEGRTSESFTDESCRGIGIRDGSDDTPDARNSVLYSVNAFDITSLFVIVALIWFWLDSLGVRDAGILAVRSVCESENLQLLDDTVAIASLKLTRNDDGQIELRRVYSFEYSDTGNNRRNGSVVMLGKRVGVINIGLRLVDSDTVLH